MYEAEISFLNKKLPRPLEWQERVAIEQVISPVMSSDEAEKLLASFKNVLGQRAGILFDHMFRALRVTNNTGGFRLVVAINPLRKVFANDIDNYGGGGGRGYNPRTNMTRSRV